MTRKEQTSILRISKIFLFKKKRKKKGMFVNTNKLYKDNAFIQLCETVTNEQYIQYLI